MNEESLYKLNAAVIVVFAYRISEELQLVPVERIHKNVDFGEQIFIEKFLALETSIWENSNKYC